MTQIICPCPPLADGAPRHEADTVNLRERLGFVQAESIRNRIAMRQADAGQDLEPEEVLAILTEGYILYGVESWTLADDAGPLAVTRTNIRAYIVDRWDIAPDVAEDADEAYASAVMLPLLAKASRSLPSTPTEPSTSPSPSTGTEVPTPSKRSSTTTTPTDAIEPTILSRAGASSTSRKSTSAA